MPDIQIACRGPTGRHENPRLGLCTADYRRTRHHGDYAGLIMAGANHVVPEMFEASLLMAAEALTMLGFAKAEAEQQIDAERRIHRHLRWTSRLG